MTDGNRTRAHWITTSDARRYTTATMETIGDLSWSRTSTSWVSTKRADCLRDQVIWLRRQESNLRPSG